MTTYDVITNSHWGEIPAWDGVCMGSGPCSGTRFNDLSRPKGNCLAPPSYFTTWKLEYEPKTVSEYRGDPSKMGLTGTGLHTLRRSGQLKMSALQRSRVTTINNLVRVPKIGDHVSRLDSKYTQFPTSGNICAPPYTVVCTNKKAGFDYNHWEEQGDINKWTLYDGLLQRSFSEIRQADILDASIQVKEEATLKSFRDYDALTDAFQYTEMAVSLAHDLRDFSNTYTKFLNRFPLVDVLRARKFTPRQLLRSSERILRSIGSTWLKYRYSVMTTVMSINDVRRLMDKQWLIQDRAARVITPTPLYPSTSGNYIAVNITGSVKVRATVTTLYLTSKLAQLMRTGLNPLTTAYEYIPYSFVADWFINTGDYILAKSNLSFAQDVACCLSTKTDTTETYDLHYQDPSGVTAGQYGSINSSVCWPGAASSYQHPGVSNPGVTDSTLRTVHTERYSRSLFARGGAVNLRINPNLSWRRVLDAAALTLNYIPRIGKGTYVPPVDDGSNHGRSDTKHWWDLSERERMSYYGFAPND